MPRILKIKKRGVEESHLHLSNGELMFKAMEGYGYESATFLDGKLKKTIAVIEQFKEAIGNEEYDNPNLFDCRLREFITASIPETVFTPFLILRVVSQSRITYELINITMQQRENEVVLDYIIAKKDPAEGTISFWENKEWVTKISGNVARKVIFYSTLNDNIEDAFFSILYPYDDATISKAETFLNYLENNETIKNVKEICSLNDQINKTGICLFTPLLGFILIPRCPHLMGSAIRFENGNFELLWYISEKQLRSSLNEIIRPSTNFYSAHPNSIKIDAADILNVAHYLIGAYNGKYALIRTLLPNKKKVSIPFHTKQDLDEDRIISVLKKSKHPSMEYTDADIKEVLARLTHVHDWVKHISVRL